MAFLSDVKSIMKTVLHDSRIAGPPWIIACVSARKDLSTARGEYPCTPAPSMRVTCRWSNSVIPGSTKQIFRIQRAFSGPFATAKSWAISRAITIEVSDTANISRE